MARKDRVAAEKSRSSLQVKRPSVKGPFTCGLGGTPNGTGNDWTLFQGTAGVKPRQKVDTGLPDLHLFRGDAPWPADARSSTGTRARIYDTVALRDAASADGLAWDPPGHSPQGKSFLFAPGRTGYHSGGPKVTHGGLSLDEVVVPFVQVTAR